MTDGLSMQKCPKCGKENLAYMTHCVHCGAALEAMFSFDGEIDLPENTPEEDVATLPFILEEMQSAPQLIEDDTTDKDEDNSEAQETDSDTPEWLKRVRQRAQAEEDASGRLTKSLNTMQERLEDDTKSDADSQYQDWLDDLREKAELKKAKQAERLKPSPKDEQGVPEWLRRIRALHPEDEGGEDLLNPDDEWTEEALEELRKKELGDDYVPLKVLENKEPDEASEDDEDEPDIPDEPDEPEIEHNIPEDDLDLESTNALRQEEEAQAKTPEEPLSEETGFVIVGDVKLNPNEVFDTQITEVSPEKNDEGLPAIAKRALDADREAILQDLVILRGQHEKVALLKTLLSEEGRPLPGKNEEKAQRKDYSRLIIGLAIISILLLSIIFIPRQSSAKAAVSVPQERFSRHLDTIDKDEKVLLVMSYSAASAPELEALAAPVLQHLNNKGLSWQAITLRMDGVWLAESLYQQAKLENHPAPVYIPGGQFAMLDMALNPKSDTEVDAKNAPKEAMPNLEGFDFVLLLTDSSFTVRGWLEQVAPNYRSLNTLAIISQKEAVAIQPYFASGQILAYLTGVGGLKEANLMAGINPNVYTVGLLSMVLLLILGISLRRVRDEQPKTEDGGQA